MSGEENMDGFLIDWATTNIESDFKLFIGECKPRIGSQPDREPVPG